MSYKIKDIAEFMNNLAPNQIAYSWDNVGLLIGDQNQDVQKILITLDLTPNIINLAIEKNINLIITHHPFLFHPLKKINDPNILKLIKNSIAVYSAHTNLDQVKNGVNFALAEKLNLSNLQFLQKNNEQDFYQITVYTPESALDNLKNAVFSAGAGYIGEYSMCSNHYPVKGNFLPSSNANPNIGTPEQLELVDEIKLEFLSDSVNLKQVINALINAHPYETPVYTITKLNQNSPNFGLGLIGSLENELTLSELAVFVKEKLLAPSVKLWPANKSPHQKVKQIAVCGGSGSSVLSSAKNADVLITGDLNYHTILDSKIPLIDAGHFYTEYPVLEKLKNLLTDFNLDIEIVSDQIHDINKLIYFS